MTQRWKQAPANSNWGQFGADDQRGRMNLVGPAQVLSGIAEVKTGQTFSLSLPLDFPGGNALNPARFPPLPWWAIWCERSAGTAFAPKP